MPDEFLELAERVNNWGRWGDDDERGTLNLIDDAAVQRGVESVRTGERFSLALPLSADGPQTGLIEGRINPLRTMTHVNAPVAGSFCMSDDVVVMGLQAATHWDALTHVSYEGRIYNGFGAETITARGAARCGIEGTGPIVTRGVLLDVPRTKGVDRLDGGYAISPDDLTEAATVDIQPGDVVLVRTGQIGMLHDGDKRGYAAPTPGLGMRTAAWFHERDVAAVATDTMALEVFPPERDDCFLPVHLLHLVEMGMLQGQNFDLEALSGACASDGRYTFLLEATPEPFVGAVGAPVVPVAVR